MLFNSIEFAIFFAAFLLLYFSTPSNRRWVVILIGSYLFYMAWKPAFGLFILGSTTIDYFVAIGMSRTSSKHRRRLLLGLTLVTNLGLLFTFKYLDFFISTTLSITGLLGLHIDLPLANLILPVGISFYTFQTLSYTIDVYRGQIPAERHFGRFAGYVVFFPQLVAGPIERAGNLIPQFSRPTRLEYSRIRDGAVQVAWGLFKKICVADLVAPFVVGVYAEPSAYNGSYLLLATVFFALQIYCDFSGYSDMAVGLAKMLGYDLMTNFRQPYFSTTLADFWRRWHISLSTWFRDYVYVPLGGSRVSAGRWAMNIMAVFLVSGFWHGAAWTFIIWGGLHGMWLLLEAAVIRSAAKVGVGGGTVMASMGPFVGFVVTNAIVLLSWVFFRAKSLDDALYILQNIPKLGPLSYGTFKILNLPSFELMLAGMQITLLFFVDYILANRPDLSTAIWSSRYLRWLLFLMLVLNITFFGVFDKADFIYFQF